jgi:hypothetical protein
MDTTRQTIRRLLLGEVFGKPLTFAWVNEDEAQDPIQLKYALAGRKAEDRVFTVRNFEEFRREVVDAYIRERSIELKLPAQRAAPMGLVFRTPQGDWELAGALYRGDEKLLTNKLAGWYDNAGEASKERYTN